MLGVSINNYTSLVDYVKYSGIIKLEIHSDPRNGISEM